MKEFANYLFSKSIVPKKQVPYYAGWVQAFFHSLGKEPTETITSEEVEQYLKGLAHHLEDWQVKQAEQAIRIFLYYQKRKRQAPVLAKGDTDHAYVGTFFIILYLKYLIIRNFPLFSLVWA